LRRFDREGANRIPFLSAMSMLGTRDNETRSYLEIADLIRLKKELIDATAAFMAPAGSGTAAALSPRPKNLTLTSPPSMLLKRTLRDTWESITAHTSRSV
jgi:hypothetical protein